MNDEKQKRGRPKKIKSKDSSDTTAKNIKDITKRLERLEDEMVKLIVKLEVEEEMVKLIAKSKNEEKDNIEECIITHEPSYNATNLQKLFLESIFTQEQLCAEMALLYNREFDNREINDLLLGQSKDIELLKNLEQILKDS